MLISKQFAKRLLSGLSSLALVGTIYSCAASSLDDDDGAVEPEKAQEDSASASTAEKPADEAKEEAKTDEEAKPAEEAKPETAAAEAPAAKPAEQVAPEIPAPPAAAPAIAQAPASEAVPAPPAIAEQPAPAHVDEPTHVTLNENTQNDGTTGEYLVEPGDTLGMISTKIYGTSSKWHELAEGNNIKHVNRLHVGDVIHFKLTKKAQAFYSRYQNRNHFTVQVKSGDTLSKISGEVLGNQSGWKLLWHWNSKQINNPNKIQVGMKLKYYGNNNASVAHAKAKAPVTDDDVETDDSPEASH